MSVIDHQLISSVSLTSSYTAYAHPDGHTSVSTPSLATASYTFSYAGLGVEPGSTINSVKLKVGSFGTPLHGTNDREIYINASDPSPAGNISAGVEYDITSLCTSGTNTVQLRFRSGTSNTSYPSDDPGGVVSKPQSSSLSFNDVRIIIDYTLPYTNAAVSSVLIQNSSGIQYAASGANVTLSWVGTNGNYNPIVNYTIQRRANGGAWADLTTVTASPLTVAAHTTAGSNYEYQVRANAANGNSGFVISPALYTYSAPSVPTGLTLNPSTVFIGQTTTLSWNASTPGAGVGISQYEIQRNGVYLTVDSVSPLTITAPTTAGSYTYRIKAVGAVAGYDSAYTATVTLVVQNPASTFTLNKSSVPADGVNSISVTITPADPAYSHTVQWYIDGVRTQTNTLNVGINTDSYTVPLSWCAAFPSATSGTAYCKVTTKNGAVTLGEVTQSFTITVPASVVPTVSLACSPSGSPTGYTSYYLLGISKCSCVATAAGAQGSTITNLTFNTNGESSSGVATTWLSSVLLASGTQAFSVTVTDSRGRSVTSTVVNITITNYSLPGLVLNNCYRCDAAGIADGNGTYYAVKATGTVSAVGANAISVLRVRSLQFGGAWSGYTTLTNGVLAIVGADAISTSYNYTIEVSINDSIGTALSRANSVVTGNILPAVRAGDIRNDRAAFGRIASTAKRVMIPNDWDYEQHGLKLDDQYAAIGHNHSGVYSPTSHNHDSAYSSASHNHDSVYVGASNPRLYSSDIQGNLDTMYTPSVFGWSSSTTGRPSDWGQGIAILSSGLVHNNSTNWITQLGFGTDNMAYYRTKVNSGAWGAWARFYDTLHKPSASDVGALPLSGGSISGKTTIVLNTSNPTYASGHLELQSTNGSDVALGFHRSGYTACALIHESNGLKLVTTDHSTLANLQVGILATNQFGPTPPTATYVGQLFFKTS